MQPRTTIAAIVAYWETRIDESEIGVDWEDARERCWRCASKGKPQRCHIIPASLGGLDEPGNYVLLCNRCHAEAPNVADSRFMWEWLRKNHAVGFYETYHIERGVEEFKKTYGRAPYFLAENNANYLDDLMARFKAALHNVSADAATHFGQGRRNAATWVWIMKEIENQMYPLALRQKCDNDNATGTAPSAAIEPNEVKDAEKPK